MAATMNFQWVNKIFYERNFISEYFQQKVEDMYRILMGISRELSNIKQIMAEEGGLLSDISTTKLYQDFIYHQQLLYH